MINDLCQKINNYPAIITHLVRKMKINQIRNNITVNLYDKGEGEINNRIRGGHFFEWSTIYVQSYYMKRYKQQNRQ